MHADSELIASTKIKKLVVRNYQRDCTIPLSTTFSCDKIPASRSQIPCPEMVNQWPHLARIKEKLMPYQHDVEVGLLIGSNCSRAIMPREIIPSNDNGPYAQRSELGWGIIGNVIKSRIRQDENQRGADHFTHRVTSRTITHSSSSQQKTCYFSTKTFAKEIINPVQVKQMMESDFSERSSNEQPISQDNRRFMLKMEQGIPQREDGHYEMPLPFREEAPKLPNNKPLALHRLTKLKTRLERDEQYSRDYVSFMNDLISKGYAERIPEQESSKDNGRVWYIPHHGVYHPKKPTKMRVVFDCSAKYRGESLNAHLLQGPDLTNQLLGVLCRLKSNTTHKKDAKDRKAKLKRGSALCRLDPFLDNDGLIRVGGRINRAEVSYHIKHPVVLPRKGHIMALIIRHYHQRINHQGRGITLNAIRENGFWVIGGNSAVSRHIADCVSCRRLRGVVGEQKMAELPMDRLEPAPLFTFCAVDYFGPWLIKEGRRELKRYGVLFTCLSSCAIHLETAKSLETDVPSASHMGGVWERQIRTARNVLRALLQKNGTQLDDESLRTFMCETEAIVNSRPLTVDNLSSPTEPEPLTPNHLLTMKTRVLLPPPGEFERADLYLTKRWRCVQYLVNQFWSRWRKEFLGTLQERKKWNNPRRNMRKGDVVLVREDTSRNCWRKARVEEAYVDDDGLVRKVRLTVADPFLNERGERIRATTILERPIQKLVLLLKVDAQ